MINLHRSKSNKWIFQKNINSANLVEAFIEAQRIQWNVINQWQTMDILRARNAYRWRGWNWTQNTMWVRLSQLCFYMFSYKKWNRFFQTPTTEMFMRNDWFWKDEACLVNQFSIQYPSPYSKTSRWHQYSCSCFRNADRLEGPIFPRSSSVHPRQPKD